MTTATATTTWFAFRAYNTETLYGYGTAEEADRYSDHLNRNREINVYAAYPISDEQAAEMGLEDAGFNLDDELAAIAGIR